MEESKESKDIAGSPSGNEESQEQWIGTSSTFLASQSTNDKAVDQGNDKKEIDSGSASAMEVQSSTESSNNSSSLPLFTKNSTANRLFFHLSGTHPAGTMHPALKTSLSDVLRKNMSLGIKSKVEKKKDIIFKPDSDAKQEMKTSISDDQGQNDSEYRKSELQIPKLETTLHSSYSISNLLKPDLPYSVRIFSASGGARKCGTPLITQVEAQKVTSEDMMDTDAKVVTAVFKSDKTVSGSGNKVPQIKVAAMDENAALTASLKSSAKVKRRKHFRGGTYGLYLSKQSRKAKRRVVRKSDISSRDDEISLASTENGSCVDSEDGSSMFSDFTPSELSLADDEACSSSRCSPVLHHSDGPNEIASSHNHSSLENQTSVSQLVSNNKLAISFSELGESQVENTSVLQASARENENASLSYMKDNICEQEVQLGDIPRSKDNESNILSSVENSAKGVKLRGSARKTFRGSPKNRIKLRQETSPQSRYKYRHFSKKLADSSEHQTNENEELDKTKSEPSHASTIATSVKSRQRMRRRFTDDIVDTDLGLLSINSLNTCKKSKVGIEPQIVQAVHISDIVPTVSEFTEKYSSISRGKPIMKAEFIFNSKKPPMSSCCCTNEGVLLNVGKDDTVICRAIDSIDDKNIGCCNEIINYPLVRPSTRIPFTVMCCMHLWRLKNHHCCPRCGRFCSQGTFIRCGGPDNDDKINHLFHEQCVGESEQNMYCLHCGNEAMLRKITLELSINSSPSSLLLADYFKTNPKARMICVPSESSKGAKNPVALKINDQEISASSFLPEEEQKTLENMLIKISEMPKEEIPDYPIHELYTAALDGSAYEVLYMLAHGVSPNTKFSDNNSETALHAAARSGSVIIAHVLVQAGCSIDAINDLLQTAIMIATENDQVDVVNYLVYMKADVDLRNDSGMACLHIAAKEGNLNLCQSLLRSLKIDLNLQDEGGWTAVVWASEHAHTDVVQLLLETGANPNLRDKEGNTALHWAAFSGDPKICQLCLTYGCNINEPNMHGDVPLHVAARQDKNSCVEYLLALRAIADIKNKAQQLPIDCCIPDSASHKALQFNTMLLQLFNKSTERMERIVSADIAMGKEKVPIQCVNWFDDETFICKDFLYVIENCETGPIKMDRSITSLQYCECKTDCGSINCTCANVSFKCWYDKEGRLVPEFNMCDPPMLFECNRACVCDASSCRNRVVQKGLMCRLQLFRTAGKGWGVRTLKDIPKGTFICEYIGELISDSEADKREDDSYLFDLDNRDGDTYCLDARHFGNVSRFINHLCEPNLIPVKVFVDYQDLSFPRIAFFSVRDIQQYEELGFDYGEKFWIIKSKWFTCNCASIGCKYSSETIQETLANYNRKNKEEQSESSMN